MSKKNEVTKAESSELVVPVNSSEWGDVEIESKDLIIAKILLQQAMSEAVKLREANDGDYLNTLTGEVVSDKDGKVEVLPFFCRQSYTIEKHNGKKFEFFKTEPYVKGGQKPFEEEIAGVKYRNMHLYEFFAMTKDGGMPVIIPFKSTSHRAGKKLFNVMYLSNVQQGKVPAHNWITLSRYQEDKDGDKFFVMDFSISSVATTEELDTCRTWIKTIKESVVATTEEKAPSTTAQTEQRF